MGRESIERTQDRTRIRGARLNEWTGMKVKLGSGRDAAWGSSFYDMVHDCPIAGGNMEARRASHENV